MKSKPSLFTRHFIIVFTVFLVSSAITVGEIITLEDTASFKIRIVIPTMMFPLLFYGLYGLHKKTTVGLYGEMWTGLRAQLVSSLMILLYVVISVGGFFLY